MDRHQLHTVDTQFEQVRDLLDDTCERSPVLDTRSCPTCKVTHMHLIDDEVVDRCFQRLVTLPVEVIEHHTGTIGIDTIPVRLFSPYIAPHNQFGIRVEQYLRLIEAKTFFRFEGAIHAEAVLYVLVIQIEDNHREHIAQTKLLEERNLDKRLFIALVEEHQRAVGGITGEYGEVHHIAIHHRTEGGWSAGTQLQPLVLMRGK